MPEYRVVAVEEGLAERVRASRKSPGYGHPVHAEVATGYGPCRLCLSDFEIGVERRLLFTLDPFHGLETFPLPGPVFIHEEPCARYPEKDGFPADIRSHDVTLLACARGRVLLCEQRLRGEDAEADISRLLARGDVDDVHVRDTSAGCYDFRVERA